MWTLSLPSEVPTNMLTLDYAYHYVFSTVPVLEIAQAAHPVLRQLMSLLCEALQALALLLFYLALVLAKLLILAFPHALKFARIVYDFHATQLTATDLAIEAATLLSALLLLLFRRRIVLFWQRIERSISAKSKAAAQAAPHVLFFSAALALAVLGRNFILPLTSPSIMPVFTLLAPLASTLHWSRRQRASGDVDRKSLEAAERRLVLWVILGVYHAVVNALSQVPFSDRILSFLPYLRELAIVVLVWIQISSVFADLVFRAAIRPLMHRIAHYLPTASSPASTVVEARAQQASSLLTALKMLRVVSDRQLQVLHALLQDSVVSLLALVCVFLPGPLATLGMITIALLLPAFRSVVAADRARQRLRIHTHSHTHSLTDRDRERAPALSAEETLSLCQQWLHYWLCVGALWLSRAYGIALWPSLTIILSVYLQHSQLQGAAKAIDAMHNTICVMSERNRRVQEERMREREREREREQLIAAVDSSAASSPVALTTSVPAPEAVSVSVSEDLSTPLAVSVSVSVEDGMPVSDAQSTDEPSPHSDYVAVSPALSVDVNDDNNDIDLDTDKNAPLRRRNTENNK